MPDLFEHLACADAAVVQGGLSTTMDLVATGRPFIYFPLRRHWEQQHFVTHRLGHYRAGLRMDYTTTSPGDLADAMRTALAHHGTNPGYRRVPAGARTALPSASLPCWPPGDRYRPQPVHSREGGAAPIRASGPGTGPAGRGPHDGQDRPPGPAAAPAEGVSHDHPNEDLLRRGHQAFSSGDMTTALSILADDISWHVAGSGGLARDYAAPTPTGADGRRSLR